MTDRADTITALWERWNSGQRTFDLAEVDPEVELHSAMTGRVYHGHDGVREWIGEIDENFETWRLWIDEFRQPDRDRTLALGGVHLRGRASGVEFEQSVAWLIDFREGLIARMRIFADQDAAIEAVG